MGVELLFVGFHTPIRASNEVACGLTESYSKQNRSKPAPLVSVKHNLSIHECLPQLPKKSARLMQSMSRVLRPPEPRSEFAECNRSRTVAISASLLPKSWNCGNEDSVYPSLCRFVASRPQQPSNPEPLGKALSAKRVQPTHPCASNHTLEILDLEVFLI